MSYCIPILNQHTGDPQCRINSQHRELVKLMLLFFQNMAAKNN